MFFKNGSLLRKRSEKLPTGTFHLRHSTKEKVGESSGSKHPTFFQTRVAVVYSTPTFGTPRQILLKKRFHFPKNRAWRLGSCLSLPLPSKSILILWMGMLKAKDKSCSRSHS
jgi:hypothetical protein